MAADPHQISQTISVGPWGGDGGDSWDDGVNAGIRQIKLKWDRNVIHSINIAYDWNGVSLWSKHGGKGGKGGIDIKKTCAIELDYPKERITSISGHYDNYVKSLTFESNVKKIYGPYGVEDGTYFSFSMAEGKIVGFHGRSGDYLDCIGVYISNLQAPTIRKNLVGPWGGKGGNSWDDGVNAGIRQIILAHGSLIDSIKIGYQRNGALVWSKHGGSGGNNVDKIELKYPEERITSIRGYYDTYVRSLTFESNLKIYGPYGVEDGTYFSFSRAKGEIVGFHGRSGWYLDCIGVIPKSLKHELFDTQLEGESGDLWDDGVYSGIHQIIVVYNEYAIDSIHIEYDNNGSPFWLERGGSTIQLSYNKKIPETVMTEKNPETEKLMTAQIPETGKVMTEKIPKTAKIRFDYPKEVLTSISGHYDLYLKSLAFESNLKKYGPYGSTRPDGSTGGTDFKFPKSDCKIVGFYGRSRSYELQGRRGSCGSCFFGLGVSFSPLQSVPISVGPWGNVGGYQWDDGVYSGIHQIIVVYGGSAIGSIHIQYDNNGSPFWPDHGESNGESNGNKIGKIQLDYPTEILTSISGRYDTDGIKSLTFESNLKKHGPFGIPQGDSFSVPTRNGKIVGFYGWSDKCLLSLGVNISNLHTAVPPKPISVGPWGGEGGDMWDDAVYSGIRQIKVYYDDAFHISSIHIEYDNNGSPISLKHGGTGSLFEEIKLDYPEEILISVSGYYDTYFRILTFKSNKKEKTFSKENNKKKEKTFSKEPEQGTYFSFPIKVGKIVSFHGRSDEYLRSIGVYLSN